MKTLFGVHAQVSFCRKKTFFLGLALSILSTYFLFIDGVRYRMEWFYFLPVIALSCFVIFVSVPNQKSSPLKGFGHGFFAFALMLPVVVMLLGSLNAASDLFSHLWATVLPEYISNTLVLGVLVALLSLCFGVPAAAIISQTNIVMGKQLRWLLMLPLAMPAYLVAYLYTDLFDYAGPVQRSLRAWFDWQSPNDYYFFDIRTMGGAAIVIALVLFPYVYMLTRTAFEQQDRNLLRASRLLGCSERQSFYQIALPLARPAIAVSLALVIMETLADFATVQYFAVNTLTTAIYDTWLGYSDFAAANALASVLMLFILFVVVAEQRARAGQRHQSSRPNTQHQRKKLSFTQQVTASLFCWFLVFCLSLSF